MQYKYYVIKVNFFVKKWVYQYSEIKMIEKFYIQNIQYNSAKSGQYKYFFNIQSRFIL